MSTACGAADSLKGLTDTDLGCCSVPPRNREVDQGVSDVREREEHHIEGDAEEVEPEVPNDSRSEECDPEGGKSQVDKPAVQCSPLRDERAWFAIDVVGHERDIGTPGTRLKPETLESGSASPNQVQPRSRP